MICGDPHPHCQSALRRVLMQTVSLRFCAVLVLLAACTGREQAQPEPAAATPALRDTVVLETSKGRLVMELDREHAPVTVANFLRHVGAGFYDGLIFHRIAPDFVIQAGAVTENMGERKSTIFPIENEADNGLKNLRGTVAMARTLDPHSATSEFFINLKDNAKLDYTAPTERGWGYAVFGRVIEGLDVVDAIARAGNAPRRGYREFPKDPTVIQRAYRLASPPPAGQE